MDSSYMKLSPIGGMLVVPEFPVKLFVSVGLIKFVNFLMLFSSLRFFPTFVKNTHLKSLFYVLIIVVSMIGSSSYFLRLETEFPNKTFRWFCEG